MPGLIRAIALSILLVPLLTTLVAADETDSRTIKPFYSHNQNPFVQIFGLPAAAPGTITGKGKLTGRLVATAANSMSMNTATNEQIVLDGETYRTVGVFRYGLQNDWELGLDLPYIAHNRGIFDHFVDDWHNFFNLPQGKRPSRERNLLEYRYMVDGHTRFLLDRPASGLGDIVLSSGYQLYNNHGASRAAALRTSIKLPTGKTKDLCGSGAADLSIGLFASDSIGPRSWDLSIFGGSGLLLAGKGKVFAERQRPLIGFASAGIGWLIWEWFDLKLQFDGHTPFYESRLKDLGKGSIQVNMGGSLHFTPATVFTLNIAEDLMVDTAPDVVFHIELQTTF